VAETLWQHYRATGDAQARSQLLDLYLGLVHHAARDYARSLPEGLELDELLSAGTVGLVQALEGFDPERGLAFSTYAMPRIRGAMLDELRSRDWVPRSVRTRGRRLEQVRAALQNRLGRMPAAAEMAQALGVDLDIYWSWSQQIEGRAMLRLDQPVTAGPMAEAELALAETIADPAADPPGEALMRREALTLLGEALGSLPAKDRLVLSLYYYEGLSLREIGEVLHVTESRVSQIRSSALRSLRERIARQEASS
jgi:RNA polymerase sigma factor for flagellar operon FliA